MATPEESLLNELRTKYAPTTATVNEELTEQLSIALRPKTALEITIERLEKMSGSTPDIDFSNPPPQLPKR